MRVIVIITAADLVPNSLLARCFPFVIKRKIIFLASWRFSNENISVFC